ncbi:PREDICTED: uncharacterized protein LOC109113864 [Nelumbo nucifera]|uniref:Hepatoma-derived growth factor-related protein 2-like n=2 Tax=Nelumbo nucifera TaxID=4432 RepID=A0A822XX95_NELNU|nr:PREDICTED: uncharacterized protein LOC109113864 [Nelumbo nucifera]DAD24947.1 TPA_asm: hypothetical protein HUJ06_026411 [Nelumbo nucifera]
MADFSFLSDSDESAVENIISQAKDLVVLEQVSAINCSGISDSVLPTELETRFRKLKSFPGAKPKLKTQNPSSNPEKRHSPPSSNRCKREPTSPSDEKSDHNLQSQSPPHDSSKFDAGKELKSSSEDQKFPSPLPGQEDVIATPVKSKDRKDSNPRLRTTGYVSSPSSSSDSSLEASSPPRQTCCFWYSPKRVPRKKGKENRVTGLSIDTPEWEKNDQDLTKSSLKHQRRKLKKALGEEEEINREVEKVLRWAKQASARMEVSTVEDLLSDDEIFK